MAIKGEQRRRTTNSGEDEFFSCFARFFARFFARCFAQRGVLLFHKEVSYLAYKDFLRPPENSPFSKFKVKSFCTWRIFWQSPSPVSSPC